MAEKRVYFLDGLRGILAVIVFVHHFLYAFFPDIIFGGVPQDYNTTNWTVYKLLTLTPVNIFFNPGAAINFFFLLSGYVQTYSYFKNEDISFLQKSFIKRYFRLAIPILSVVMIVFAFHKLNFIHKEYFPKTITTNWVQSMLPDVKLPDVLKYGIFDCFNNNHGYYQILWTMPIELSNSWMVLILLFVTHNFKNKSYFFIFWIFVQLFFLNSFHSVSFTFGMLICYLDVKSSKFKEIFSKPISRVICFFVGIYFASYPYLAYDYSIIKKSMYGLISFYEKYPSVLHYLTGNLLLFCAILNFGRIKRLLSKRGFQFFGKISFMFYLTHFILIFSFSPWLYNILLPHFKPGVNVLITGSLTFVAITGFSYVLYKLVDKPAIKLCSDYYKKIFEVNKAK